MAIITDNDGNSLANVSIPAPHTVKSNSGTQMNPNTIYYTDESGLNGAGNLAVKQGDGTWRVAALRIFDGWDWAPRFNIWEDPNSLFADKESDW